MQLNEHVSPHRQELAQAEEANAVQELMATGSNPAQRAPDEF